ncbi:hypothetical protein DFS34DRAFT_233949 [Phlyctochytrium arcticum]|nr:hypothetical protein DFS34DRAFT_233949 [Phlyctochytrium arcticum]
MAIVSPSGCATQLSLYHFPILPMSLWPPAQSDVDAAFPLHQVLAIKEPYLKMANTGDTPLVRVDSPSDLMFVPRGHAMLEGVSWKALYPQNDPWVPPLPKVRSVEEWKLAGNKFFTTKRYFLALKEYTGGIEEHESGPAVAVLFLNRAAALLLLERYNAVLADIEKCMEFLSDDSDNLLEKAYMRKCKALYELRRWSDALQCYREMLDKFPRADMAKNGIERVQKRLLEETHGSYDLVKIYNENQRPRPCIDAADFIGPVEVKNIEKKGLGVVVTKDVHAGELLMATKAFIYITPSTSDEQIFSLNFLTNSLDRTTDVNAVTETVYKLDDRPEAAQSVYSLFAGSAEPRSLYDLREVVPNTAHDSVTLDVAKIERVLSYNAFGPGQVSAATFQTEPDDPNEEKPTALFRQSSLINHSCLYNSTWTCFGDFQFVRALIPMKKGEEVLVSYTVDGDFASRRKALSGKHVKDCRCPLCEAELSDGNERLATRSRLVATDLAMVSYASPEKDVRKAIAEREKNLRDIQETYGSDRQLRPELFSAHNRLAFAYGVLAVVSRDPGLYKKVLSTLLEALRCLDVVIEESSGAPKNRKAGTKLPIVGAPRQHSKGAVSTALQVAACYTCLGQKKLAKGWVQAAMWMEEVTVGPGAGLFKLRYEQMLASLDLTQFVK